MAIKTREEYLGRMLSFLEDVAQKDSNFKKLFGEGECGFTLILHQESHRERRPAKDKDGKEAWYITYDTYLAADPNNLEAVETGLETALGRLRNGTGEIYYVG